MHSLELYSIRVFDHMLSGTSDDKYSKLSDLRGHDLEDILYNYFESFSSNYIDIREAERTANPSADLKDIPKRLYKFSDVSKSEGIITGYLNVGEYGNLNDIVNRVSSDTIGLVKVDDSVIRKHFFLIKLVPDCLKGILLIQAIRGRGAKGVFDDAITPVIRDITQGLICQLRPLSHSHLVNDWLQNAQVCEIRLSHFSGNSSINDIADSLGDTYSEIKIKPRKKNVRLGRIADLNSTLVDLMLESSSSVKAVMEYNGRKRVFALGSDESPVSSIEISEEDTDLIFVDGSPTLESLQTFSSNLADEVWNALLEVN